jgi:hypothetical protein
VCTGGNVDIICNNFGTLCFVELVTFVLNVA